MAPKIRLSPPPPPAQAQPLRRPSRPQLEDDVIEGEGHTVEIDVAELKTLIKAAEAKEAATDDGPDSGEAASGSSSEQRPAA
jgi:hypothetical protein